MISPLIHYIAKATKLNIRIEADLSTALECNNVMGKVTKSNE